MFDRPDSATTVALLNEAIALHGGSEAALARAAGYSQNALWHARRVGRVSADLALAIGKATDQVVSIGRLRPDLSAACIPQSGDRAHRADESSRHPISETEQSLGRVHAPDDRGVLSPLAGE
jgi:DNA-binding transcriptional regulator YdaS (Cro superfamily)